MKYEKEREKRSTEESLELERREHDEVLFGSHHGTQKKQANVPFPLRGRLGGVLEGYSGDLRGSPWGTQCESRQTSRSPGKHLSGKTHPGSHPSSDIPALCDLDKQVSHSAPKFPHPETGQQLFLPCRERRQLNRTTSVKALRMLGGKVWPTESLGACHWFLYGLQAKTAIYLYAVGKISKERYSVIYKNILNVNFTVHTYGFCWNMITPIPCPDICHGFCTK